MVVLKMPKALNSPLSPHPVGLITTSFSLLQPLRNPRTARKQNALAKNMAFFFFLFLFGTVSLWWRPLPPLEFRVFFFFVFCFVAGRGATSTLAALTWTERSGTPPSARFSRYGDPLGPSLRLWDRTQDREQLRHFRRKFTSGKDS